MPGGGGSTHTPATCISTQDTPGSSGSSAAGVPAGPAGPAAPGAAVSAPGQETPPSLVRTLRLIQPSSAMTERAFSVIMNNTYIFGAQQTTVPNDFCSSCPSCCATTMEFASAPGETLRTGVLRVVVPRVGGLVLARPCRLTTGQEVAAARTATNSDGDDENGTDDG